MTSDASPDASALPVDSDGAPPSDVVPPDETADNAARDGLGARLLQRLTALRERARHWDWHLLRDELMLMMCAINLLFLGLDTWISHQESGTIVPNEWIPVYFGTAAGVAMLVAGAIARRSRYSAVMLATLVLVASIVVGVLGAWFHLQRGMQPDAPAGERLTMDLMVWAPPVLGPLAFAMVGILGISAAWPEMPRDSGRLKLLWANKFLQLPFSKTRAYYFIVAMGVMVSLVSSTLDHARYGFAHDLWVWVPLVIGTFAIVATLMMGILARPTRADRWTYLAAMGLMLAAGPVGLVKHVEADLALGGAFVLERFLKGAPVLAPMLYTNMGLLGLLAMLGDWTQRQAAEDEPTASVASPADNDA